MRGREKWADDTVGRHPPGVRRAVRPLLAGSAALLVGPFTWRFLVALGLSFTLGLVIALLRWS